MPRTPPPTPPSSQPSTPTPTTPTTPTTPMPTPTPTPTQPPHTQAAYPIRVRYCECDPMGVAHHSSYIPWLEEARTELLRSSGISYAQLEEAGIFLAVVKLNITYRRPARYDDLLDIDVRLVRTSRVKLMHEYAVNLRDRPTLDRAALADLTAGTGLTLALASTTLACIDANGSPIPLPDWLSL